MGASFSKSSSKTTNTDIVKIITNVVIKQASRCEGTTVLDTVQDMDLSGSDIRNSKVVQAVDVVVDISCLASSSDNMQLQTEIEAKLKQHAEAQAKADPTLLNANVAISDSEAVSNTVRDIATNIDIDSVKSCMNSYKANLTQRLRATNATISDSEISQQIKTKVVMECILSDANQIARVEKLSSLIDQSSAASAASGFDMTALIAISVLIIALCCSVVSVCLCCGGNIA